MAKGKRLGLVWSSQLLSGEDIDVANFIETGSFGDGSESGPVLPANDDLRAVIVKAFEHGESQ